MKRSQGAPRQKWRGGLLALACLALAAATGPATRSMAQRGPRPEASAGARRPYDDAEAPLRQRVNGKQLTAPALFKLIVSRGF